MAITTEINNLMATVPSGYTKPTVTISFSGTPNTASFETTIAATNTHASAASTGLTDVLTAFKTWLDGTYVGTNLGLDSSATIEGIADIISISRENSGFTSNVDVDNIFITGTDQLRIKFAFRWEKS